MHFHFLSGPRRAKKVLFLFLQKLFWHFYSISRSCSCTCFTEYKELNLDALVVNRWSYIIISEKRLFLACVTYSLTTFFATFPFLYIQKILQTTQKNFAFSLFRVVGVTFVWLVKAFYDIRLFSSSAEKSFLQRLCSPMQDFCYPSSLWGIISGSNAKICGTCPSSCNFAC